MKTCPVCALDLEDSYLFCPDDGSNLNPLPRRSSVSESLSAPGPVDETAGAVVLYCPTCAAEYPLTFSSCPVHGVQLTKHRIPRSSRSASQLSEPGAGARATVARRQFPRDESRLTKPLTTLDLTRPQIESPRLITRKPDDVGSEFAANVAGNAVDPPANDTFGGGITAFDYQESGIESHERRMERPGFRVAAIVTVIALALFGLVAVYTFVSNFSRRSPSSAGKTASTAQSAPQPLPFVATPQEAQDYKEETRVALLSTQAESEPAVERVRRDSASSSSTGQDLRKGPNGHAMPKAPAATPPPSPVTTARVSNPPMPALPRGNSGGFDARLIRVRSRKTPAGFRYDLTFNMQEQAGRSAHWQRVLITTRSASGASHSEAIPFSHRLGATGALTFTISVELTGRSEADWQGRVVCTTLGWDNKGAPLQASFGASVTP